MNTPFVGYLAVFGAAAAACLLGAYRARRISDPDTRAGLVALLLTSAGWAGTYIGAFLASPPTLVRGFYLAGLVVGASTVGAWLWFCSAYTGRTLHRNPILQRTALVLFVGIAGTKLTNPWHGLYFYTEPAALPFPHLAVHYQPLYWINVGLAYGLAGVGYFLLFSLFRTVESGGGRLGLLAGLTALPLAGSITGELLPGLLNVAHEPLGVAAFAIGVTGLYRDQFQSVQITGTRTAPTFRMAPDGTLVDYNEQAAALLPASHPDSALGQPLAHVLPDVAAALQDGTSILQRPQGSSLRYYQLSTGEVAVGSSPSRQLLLSTDVTDRFEQQKALARRKALLEAQAESTLDGLLVVDPDFRVVFYNDRFLELWTSSDDLPDASLDEQSFLQVRRALIDPLLPHPDAFADKVEHLRTHPRAETRALFHLVDDRWIDWYSSPIVHQGTHFGRLWSFRDVTERRRMLERLLEVQEEERRRIDQEIHDQMGGLMSALQFKIDLLRRELPEATVPTSQFEQMEELVDGLSTATRKISRKLYPGALSVRGLAEVLPSLYRDLETEYGLMVTDDSDLAPDDRFSTLVERTVYWIIQEALINVSLHADTDEAHVVITSDEHRLSLHILDEGRGFDVSNHDDDKSFGLEGIRRRVERLNGTFELASTAGEGTRLSIVLPHHRPLLEELPSSRGPEIP
ncbi:MAG: hypothetical protein BRD55_01375 [Bacteroidetes bacterium SW_9_63_38]|nr:MAG: hypothetical protein BRD55_01375 [Bacteroidetes bacterium SW_9_63_38]